MSAGLYVSVGDADADLAALGLMENWNREGVSDPLAKPNLNAFRPGQLKMGAAFELHTRAAINLFRGRRAEPEKGVRPVIGLLRFANQVSKVWTGASRNDPIADLILIRTEEAFERADAKVDQALSRVNSMIDAMASQGFSISNSLSVNPVKLELGFSTPWAWKGAQLLKKYDQLILSSLTAQHLALIVDSDDWNLLVNQTARALRNFFIQPDAYVLTNLKRHDFKRTSKYLRRHYGKAKRGVPFVPEDILKGERRAKIAPSIKHFEQINREELAEQRKASAKTTSDKNPAEFGSEQSGVDIESVPLGGNDAGGVSAADVSVVDGAVVTAQSTTENGVVGAPIRKPVKVLDKKSGRTFEAQNPAPPQGAELGDRLGLMGFSRPPITAPVKP